MLAGCGGGSDAADGDTAKPPTSSSETTSDAPEEADARGTFMVSGAVEGQGPLSDVVCAPREGGIQVTAEFSASGTSGRLTVISGPGPSDHERGDDFTTKGENGKIYSRIGSDTLPYDITDDGSKVTGSVVLADIQDIVKPNVKDRKQVKLTVDIDCGTA